MVEEAVAGDGWLTSIPILTGRGKPPRSFVTSALPLFRTSWPATVTIAAPTGTPFWDACEPGWTSARLTLCRRVGSAMRVPACPVDLVPYYTGGSYFKEVKGSTNRK